jgi:hypothetical protein
MMKKNRISSNVLRHPIFVLLFAIGFTRAFALDISGTVTDSVSKAPIEGVLVKAMDGNKLLAYANTLSSGTYKFRIESPPAAFTLSFQHLSYEGKSASVTDKSRQVNARLKAKVNALREYSIVAPKILVKEDTVSFSVASFTKVGDRTIEDVLKNLPGLKVLESGKIQYQGKDISHFSIEGMDALNGKYVLATRNLEAKDVNRVEMVENFQKTKMKQGEQSEEVAMNLKLNEAAKMKLIGTQEAGIGARENELLYHGKLTGMIFTKKYQFIGVAKANNWGSPLKQEIQSQYDTKSTSNTAYGLVSDNLAGSTPLTYSLCRQKDEWMNSLNAQFKLSEAKTITVNTDYLRDRNQFRFETANTYYLNNDVTTITEKQTPEYATDFVKGSFKYVENAPGKYVENATTFDAQWVDNSFGLIHNGTAIQQVLKSKLTNIRNDGEVHVTVGKKRLFIYTSAGYSNLPEKRLTINGVEGQTGNFYQLLKGDNAFTINNTTLEYLFKNRSKLSIFVCVLAKYDRIYTRLQQNDSSILNRNVGFLGDLFVKPTYRYDSKDKRFGLQSSVSLHNYIVQYKNRVQQNTDYNKDLPLVNTTFSTYYLITPATKATLSGKINTEFGDLTNFVVNPVQVNYMQTSSQSGMLAKNKTESLGLQLVYQKPMDMFFSNGSVTYGRYTRNILNGTTLTVDSTNVGIGTQNVRDKNSSENLSVYGSVSKGFTTLSSTLSLSSSYSTSKSVQLRQGVKMNLGSDYFSIAPQVKTELVKKLSMVYVVQYSLSSTSGVNLTKTYHQQSHSLNVNYSPIPSWVASGSFSITHSEIIPGVYKTMRFMDAYLRYTHKRYGAELKLNNLFNLKQYSQTYLIDLDTYSSTYYLNPREAVLILRYSL